MSDIAVSLSNAVALVDCNSFYASCERVFNPRLENKPVIVLSNNDGCVVALTDESKKIGIRMGQPYFQIKDICKRYNIHAFSSNYTLYGDMSRRVMRTISDFVPEMEIYSIDEAFLNFAGFREVDIIEYSKEIRRTVLKNTGIPVSVGIGPTKVLSKVANKIAKKNKIESQGVFSLLGKEAQERILKTFPTDDIWGIGAQSAKKLAHHRIFTAAQLRDANEHLIQKELTVVGRRIVEELRGISCIDLELIQNDKKQIVSSRSFGQPIASLEGLKEPIAHHVSTSFAKLRKQNSIAKTIIVFIHTNRFKNTPQYYNSGSIEMMSGTSVTNKAIRAAFSILEKIYKPGFEYKKAGVILADIAPKNLSQLDFFNRHDTAREDALMNAMDKINARNGKGTAHFAACGISRFWEMASRMKSRAYTTRWSEILEAK
jgi:DNA polymerase V